MNELLYQAAPSAVFAFFLAFCRIGAVFMVMPAIGEQFFSARSRLMFAIMCVICVYPTVSASLPKEPAAPIDAFLMLCGEALAGALIGYIVRIFHGAVHLSGAIISYQAGLTAAMLFDPNQSSSGTVIGNFLGIFTLTLLFSANMHHLFIRAATESYGLLPVGGLADNASALLPALLDVMARAFRVAISFSMPFMAMGLIGYLTLGVMGRLMPQMQVFFVVVPLQILIILAMLALSLVALGPWLVDQYYDLMGEML